jgi:hypothetical protein
MTAWVRISGVCSTSPSPSSRSRPSEASATSGAASATREEIADKDRRLTKVTTEAQQLRTDLDALSRVVTGEAHWTAIGDKLDEHHRDAEGHWTDEKTLLEEIRDRLPAPPPPRRGF